MKRTSRTTHKTNRKNTSDSINADDDHGFNDAAAAAYDDRRQTKNTFHWLWSLDLCKSLY